MSKPFAYWFRLGLVSSLCSLTTFSPVLAGRLIERLIHRGNNCSELVVPPCLPVPTCESPCEVVVDCDPCQSAAIAGDCGAAADCCGGIAEHSNASVIEQEPAPIVQEPAPVEPVPPVVTPTPEPAVAPVEPQASSPSAPAPAPSPAPVIESQVVEPAVTEPAAPALPPAATVESVPPTPAPTPAIAEPAAPPTAPATTVPPPLPEPTAVTEPAVPAIAEPTIIEQPAIVEPEIPAIEPVVTPEPAVTPEPTLPTLPDEAADPFAESLGEGEDVPQATDTLNDTFGEPEAATEDPFGSIEMQEDPIEADADPIDPMDVFDETPPAEEAAPANESTSPIEDLFGNEPATDPLADPATESGAATENALEHDFLSEEPEAEPAMDVETEASELDVFGEEEPEAQMNELPEAEQADALDDLLQDNDAAETTDPAFDTFESELEAPAEADAIDSFLNDDEPASATPNPLDSSEDATLEELLNMNDTSDQESENFGKPVSQENTFDAFEPSKGLFDLAPESIDSDVDVDAPAEEDLESLFGISKFEAPDQFNGAEYKVWVDNTGSYKVSARLEVIYSDKIKLLKANGKSTTVPLSRLSDRDFAYVQWVATCLMEKSTTKLVKHEAPTGAIAPVR